MLRSRAVSRFAGVAPMLVGIAVMASGGVAQAQSGPPGDPQAPPGGPPPPAGPPPPPGGYAPPMAYPPPPPPYAPPQQPEPPGIHRSGFIIGFSLGAGSIGCSDCNSSDTLDGVALEFHLGGMLTRNVALMFDGGGVAHSFEGGDTLTHVVDALALQVWAGDRVWFKGGVGIGQISISDTGSATQRSDTRAAGVFAVGVELLQGRSSALDLQLRGAATSFEGGTITNGSFLIGYSWY